MKPIIKLMLERPKWEVYKKIIQAFLDHDYQIMSVKEFVESKAKPKKYVIFRHDVDNDPLAAKKMARIEREFRINSTYYFRWKTAHPEIVKEISRDFEIGLHYETLAKIHALGKPMTSESIIQARKVLALELQEFRELFGDIESIASHGHQYNIVENTTNYQLITNEFREEHGIVEAYDIQQDMTKISDGDSTRKFWKYDISPFQAIERGEKRIYFLTHPCHWDRTLLKRILAKYYHKKYGVWV